MNVNVNGGWTAHSSLIVQQFALLFAVLLEQTLNKQKGNNEKRELLSLLSAPLYTHHTRSFLYRTAVWAGAHHTMKLATLASVLFAFLEFFYPAHRRFIFVRAGSYYCA
jgi:hypothetical protein